MNASAGNGSRWRRLWARLRGLATGLVFWLARLVPGARTRRGAVVGTYLAVLLVAAWNGTLLRNHWGAVPDALLMGLIAAGLLAVGTVVATLALTVAARLPRWTTGALVATVIVVQELLQLPGRGNGVLFWMVVMPALIGGAADRSGLSGRASFQAPAGTGSAGGCARGVRLALRLPRPARHRGGSAQGGGGGA